MICYISYVLLRTFIFKDVKFVTSANNLYANCTTQFLLDLYDAISHNFVERNFFCIYTTQLFSKAYREMNIVFEGFVATSERKCVVCGCFYMCERAMVYERFVATCFVSL